MSKAGLAAALAILAFLGAGCVTDLTVTQRALAYNEAVADSSNQLILLNALRASERMPTYYTRLASETASLTVNPTSSVAGPLGTDLARRGKSFIAQLAGISSNQLTLQSLDDQRFTRGALTPVSVDVLGFYLRQGWPPELLLMTTVSRISTTRKEMAALIAAFEKICAGDPSGLYCDASVPQALAAEPHAGQAVADRLRACMQNLANTGGRFTGEPDAIFFENYPTDAERTRCFEWALRVIVALDPVPKTYTTYALVAADVPKSQEGQAVAELLKSDMIVAPGSGPDAFNVCKKTKVNGLALKRFALAGGGKAVQSVTHSSESGIQTFARSPDAAPLLCGQPAPNAGEEVALNLQLTTRSMDGMVYYLGELIRAQHAVEGGGGGWTPADATRLWVWNPSQRRFGEWSIFLTRRGGGPVRVRFMGDTYAVPTACAEPADCADPGRRHTSLQVLALLTQIWGLQKEQVDLPVSPVVTVINP